MKEHEMLQRRKQVLEKRYNKVVDRTSKYATTLETEISTIANQLDKIVERQNNEKA